MCALFSGPSFWMIGAGDSRGSGILHQGEGSKRDDGLECCTVTQSVPLTGRLSETPLLVLLRTLQHGRKTGILTVTRNDQTRLIYFKQGDMVFASSKYEDDRLGVMLLKEGKITYVQYETSSRVLNETKKKHGTILVEQGFLTPKELFQAVNAQVKEIILSLFTWLDGEYRFNEQKLPADEVSPLRISSGELIYEGIRQITDFARLCRLLPPFDTVLRMSTDPRDLFQSVVVTPPERQLLLLIDGDRTIHDLLAAALLPTIHTLQLLYFMMAIGIIQIKPTGDAEAHAGDSQRRRQLELEAFLAEAVRLKKSDDEKDGRVELFEIVGEKSVDTSPRAITLAYETLGEKDHYEVLGLARGASASEIKMAYFKLAKAYHPDRHYEPGMEAVHPMLVALFDRLTQAYHVLNQESIQRNNDEVKAVRKHAPSTARSDEPDEQEQQAAEHCQRGEEALLAGNLKEAIACLEWAVKQDDTKARYHALLGQALAHVPNRREDAKGELRLAIELDPYNADYHIVLGLLYLEMEAIGMALVQFEEALRWDPSNAKAKEQVEQIRDRYFPA
jgi:tetratricopeptide (TPR) repeat protein